MSGRSALVKPRCSGATMRAVGSGRLMARFFGISSPTTIEKPLTRMIATHGRDDAADRLPEHGVLQRQPQQPRDGRLRGVTEQDGGQRDAQLGAGQLGRQPAQRLDHRLAAAVVGRRLALDQARVQRDQRELARDEHGGAEREQDAQADQQPLDQHAAPPGARRTPTRGPALVVVMTRRGKWPAWSPPGSSARERRRQLLELLMVGAIIRVVRSLAQARRTSFGRHPRHPVPR